MDESLGGAGEPLGNGRHGAAPIAGLGISDRFSTEFAVPLILASTSPIRRHLLAAAGLTFEAVGPGVDEAAIKARVSNDGEAALALAAAKAEAVSAAAGDAWVIGADSIVSVGGRRFDKPRDRADARHHLRGFSGQAMTLTSAVALARGGRTQWTHRDSATLAVRPLAEDFIDSYLDAEWPQVGYCAGVFRLEGRGVQLFEAIDGDHFIILGLPLLPLLGALRERGVIAS